MKHITVRTYLTIVFVLYCFVLNAQDPQIEWDNTIGGDSTEIPYSIHPTSDGGYIIGGWSSSNASGDKSEDSRGFQDYWIVKLNSSGIIEWEKTYGGNEIEEAYSIIETTDGNYVVGGVSSSGISGEKTEPNQGGLDIWILKLDTSGNIIWQQTIGGSEGDRLTSIRETDDGGFIVGSASGSDISGDKSENSNGLNDYWVLKLDSNGEIVWQNTIGGSELEILWEAEQTQDGGYILVGGSESDISGDKTENSQGGYDIWLIKLNETGSIVWQNTIGGNAADNATSIVQTIDNGYVLSGVSESDISGDKTEDGQGLGDYWILKLDGSGNILWQNTIGGNHIDDAWEIVQLANGGYVVAGKSFSELSGDKTEELMGISDFWVVRLDTDGNILWDNTIGGDSGDGAQALCLDNNGDFIITGSSSSNISGDKTENAIGSSDYWVVKLNPILSVPEFNTEELVVTPNPVRDEFEVYMSNSRLIELITIMDMNGKSVLSISNPSPDLVVDFSEFASGVYLMSVISDDIRVVKRIIKE